MLIHDDGVVRMAGLERPRLGGPFPRPAPVVLSTLPNAEWSKLFFGQHRPDLALADLVVLEAYVLGYMAAVRKLDRAASQAFIPYAWVAFAGLLNAE
jgi:tryptophan-rich sensory protein